MKKYQKAAGRKSVAENLRRLVTDRAGSLVAVSNRRPAGGAVKKAENRDEGYAGGVRRTWPENCRKAI